MRPHRIPERPPKPLRAGRIALLAAMAGALLAAASAGAETAPVPTLAVEDSLPVPRIELREVEVRARRATLDEILDRIVRGEARRDSLIHDIVYDFYARAWERQPGRESPRKTLLDQVSRVYKQQPDKRREIFLRRVGSPKVQVRSGPGMREELIKFAFDPRLRRFYRFQILGRDIVGGHVIYRLSFAPKSPFFRLPEGRLWVDTNEFVILREEFWYCGVSPAPLIFKSLDDCVVERTRVDGRYWVLSRVLARVTFTFAVFGIPPQGDLAMSFGNYRINRGIDPAIFTGAHD